MDELDRATMEFLGKALQGAAQQSEEEAQEMFDSFDIALKKGTKWIEDDSDDNPHKDITFPLYAVLSFMVMGLGIMPHTKQGIGLFSGISVSLAIAVKKGYEKGKREALAAMVLNGEVKDG